MDTGADDDGIVCPECGGTIPFAAEACPECGYGFTRPKPAFAPNVAEAAAAITSSRAATAASPALEVAPGLAAFYSRRRAVKRGEFLYGGFWRRFGGYVVDYVIWAVASVLLFGSLHALGPLRLVISIPFVVAAFLYEPYMTSRGRQATIGKQAVGVVVTDTFGNRISFGRAIARYIVKGFSVLFLGLGYLPLALRNDKRALHDLIAGTVVTRPL